ncbi:transposase [Streptomyces sp. NPDC102365]|uniref:transposase n=1 Tax=Streptomyces sp. NPDC102365 TaxID=3366162 RepID=UPI00380442AF
MPAAHALAENDSAVASPDPLQAVIKAFADALMAVEADARCNADTGRSATDASITANGYRPRAWHTRACTGHAGWMAAQLERGVSACAPG